MQSSHQSFGFGIQLKQGIERRTIATVASGSPAEQAGLRPGDELLVVDGTPFLGSRGLAPLQGKKGDVVKFVILRDLDLIVVIMNRDWSEPDTVVSDESACDDDLAIPTSMANDRRLLASIKQSEAMNNLDDARRLLQERLRLLSVVFDYEMPQGFVNYQYTPGDTAEWLVRVLIAQNSVNEAVKCADEICKTENVNLITRERLAAMLLQAKRYTEARKLLDHLIDAWRTDDKKPNPLVLVDTAECCLHTNQEDEGLDYLDELRQMYMDFAEKFKGTENADYELTQAMERAIDVCLNGKQYLQAIKMFKCYLHSFVVQLDWDSGIDRSEKWSHIVELLEQFISKLQGTSVDRSQLLLIETIFEKMSKYKSHPGTPEPETRRLFGLLMV